MHQRQSLVKKLFEDILKWCNENLDCAKGIYLPHDPNEWATLVTDFNMDTIEQGTYYSFNNLMKNNNLSGKTKLGVWGNFLKAINDWIEKNEQKIIMENLPRFWGKRH